MVFMSDHITVTQTFNGLPVTFKTFCPVCEPPKVFLFHTFLEISSLALFFNLLLPKLLAKKKKIKLLNIPLGMGMYTLLYSKWITNKDLLYSTWASAQCYVAGGWERGWGENGYMYMYD